MNNFIFCNIDGFTEEMQLLHDELKVEDTIQLTLTVCSRNEDKKIGNIYIDFGDSVLSHRVNVNSIVSKIEDMILDVMDNIPNYVAGTPLWTTESDFLEWYVNTYREDLTDNKKLIHFLAYSLEYYYEFIVNALPKITFEKNNQCTLL